jgi:hypothetical protein
LSNEQVARVCQGQTISAACDQSADEIAAVDNHGQLVALLKPSTDGRLAPLKCFTGPAER